MTVRSVIFMTKKEKIELIHGIFDSPVFLSIFVDQLIKEIQKLPYNFGSLKSELPYLDKCFEKSLKLDLRGL